MLPLARQAHLTQEQIEAVRERERQNQISVLKKKKNRAAEMRRDRFAMVTILVGILILWFSYVIIESKIYNLGFEVNSLKNEADLIAVNTERLDLEIQSLASIERIAAYAAQNLDMHYPDEQDIIYMDYQLAQDAVPEVFSPVSDASAAPNADSSADAATASGGIFDILERIASGITQKYPRVVDSIR